MTFVSTEDFTVTNEDDEARDVDVQLFEQFEVFLSAVVAIDHWCLHEAWGRVAAEDGDVDGRVGRGIDGPGWFLVDSDVAGLLWEDDLNPAVDWKGKQHSVLIHLHFEIETSKAFSNPVSKF